MDTTIANHGGGGNSRDNSYPHVGSTTLPPWIVALATVIGILAIFGVMVFIIWVISRNRALKDQQKEAGGTQDVALIGARLKAEGVGTVESVNQEPTEESPLTVNPTACTPQLDGRSVP